MRLINTSTLEIEEFVGSSVPEYVILSHTWDTSEVTFQDFAIGTAHKKQGYAKVRDCCIKAASDGFTYCWIDTCCIDKSSSSELSEALNSMYQWYKNAKICYAYLSDFDGMLDSADDKKSSEKLLKCRWWTRGWTLQELVAPKIVEFYNREWEELGTKLSLQEEITEITGIDRGVLFNADPLRRTVAVRMSWAARRKTTRIEDEAYCLMGMFGVNMPLLYGEGNRAFIRLQEEITRTTEDFTLFAWSPAGHLGRFNSTLSKGLFATSSSFFVETETRYAWSTECAPQKQPWHYRDLQKHCTSLFTLPSFYAPPSLTSRGLHITLPIRSRVLREHYACLTTFRLPSKEEVMLCVILQRLNPSEQYVRRAGPDLIILNKSASKDFKFKSIYIIQPPKEPDLPSHRWQWDTMTNLLLVKPHLQHGNNTLKCIFSSWISMASVLATRHESQENCASSLSDSQSALIAALSPESLATPSSLDLLYEKCNFDTNACFNPLLINLKNDNTSSITMTNPPNLSFFSGVSPPSNQHAVFGFSYSPRSEDAQNSSFLVHVSLYEDRPLCSVPSVPHTDLNDEEKQKEWREQLPSVQWQKDRVTLQIGNKSGSSDKGAEKLELLFSIRSIGTASVDSSSDKIVSIQRYMLGFRERRVTVL